MSKRTKRKHTEKAVGMLPEGAGEPLDYATGGAGAWPPKLLVLAVIGGLVVLSILLSLLVGGLTVIGVLPALAVFFGLNNPRGVLATTGGVASFSTSFINGKPNRLVAWDTREALGREAERRAGSTRIAIGTDGVWIRDKDLASLRAA